MRMTIAMGLVALALGACGGGDEDDASCSDFGTQREAQNYFNSHDAPQLDADNDGRACEALP